MTELELRNLMDRLEALTARLEGLAEAGGEGGGRRFTDRHGTDRGRRTRDQETGRPQERTEQRSRNQEMSRGDAEVRREEPSHEATIWEESGAEKSSLETTMGEDSGTDRHAVDTAGLGTCGARREVVAGGVASRETVYRQALRETVAVLEATRTSFRSRQLKELRERIESVLRN